MIAIFREWQQARQERRAEREHRRVIASVRALMAFFGHPVDDLTDAELVAGVAKAGKVLSRCGITVDEASAGLDRLGHILRTIDR